MSLTSGERWTCRCGEALIASPNSKTGNLAPITVEPKDNGNVLLYRVETPEGPEPAEVQHTVIGKAEVREYLHERHVPLRLNHFADCPLANQFQR